MIDNYLMKRLIESIENNCRNRSVAMYGKNDEIMAAVENRGYKVEKIFTSNLDLLADNNTQCTNYREMNNQSNRYYIVIPFILNDGSVQREILKNFGFNEIDDYIFYTLKKRNIQVKEIGVYKDEDENYVEVKSKNVDIKICDGYNNKIYIDEHLDIKGKLSIVVNGSSNVITINKNCKFIQNNIISISDKSVISISDSCRFTAFNLFGFGSNEVNICSQCTFGRNTLFELPQYSKISIGKDCMFSFDIKLQPGDGHSLFDITTKENINSNPDRKSSEGFLSEICLGEHIWIGREAMILAGLGKTEIGIGSVIGARALVKGKFPNNCVLAGIPARVVRKNVAWSRNNCSNNFNDCKGYTDLTVSD